MFFYRAQPIEATTKKKLFEKECPICGHRSLVQDHWIAFRYSPMALFRGLFLSFAIALLLSLALYKIEFVWVFLSRFSYSTQEQIVTVFLACFTIPAAFAIIHWEIKLGHLSVDDQQAVGVHCKHCGNAFAGLVDVFPQSSSHGDGSAPEIGLEGPKSSNTTIEK